MSGLAVGHLRSLTSAFRFKQAIILKTKLANLLQATYFQDPFLERFVVERTQMFPFCRPSAHTVTDDGDRGKDREFNRTL